MPKRPKSFRIDEDLCDLLASEAVRQGRSEGWVVERALEAALSEAKEPAAREQAGPGSVPSQEGARPAASPRASENPVIEELKQSGAVRPASALGVGPRRADAAALARMRKLGL